MKKLSIPFDKNDILNLLPKDIVYLTGKMYMARDMAHKIMFEQGIPFDIKGQVIYYCGPCDAQINQPIGSAGPTSSYRMDAYTPYLIEKGLYGMIGKGMRSDTVVQSIKQHKCIYFGAIGGAGAKLSKCIKSHKIIAYDQLGPEALREIYVENFPVIVIINCNGKTIFDK